MSARAAPARRRAVERWVYLSEAETYSGIPYGTLRRWISEGRLPAERVGPRRIQVNLDDLDALRAPIPAAPPHHPIEGDPVDADLRETG
jgi:excisionase family DNA binding protein